VWAKSGQQHLLQRFPQARCIAVDLDPFLLTIGRQTLGDMDGRLCWVEVDLNTPAWIEALGVTQVDAVLSTTAFGLAAQRSLTRARCIESSSK
jgi:hypothetical protein